MPEKFSRRPDLQRVQFHLNRRFLRRKLLSGTTGEYDRSLIKVEHTLLELDMDVVDSIKKESCERVFARRPLGGFTRSAQ